MFNDVSKLIKHYIPNLTSTNRENEKWTIKDHRVSLRFVINYNMDLNDL